jgi:hypothetical protein
MAGSPRSAVSALPRFGIGALLLSSIHFFLKGGRRSSGSGKGSLIGTSTAIASAGSPIGTSTAFTSAQVALSKL